jgi:iron(III) transport system substrate-binding protein
MILGKQPLIVYGIGVLLDLFFLIPLVIHTAVMGGESWQVEWERTTKEAKREGRLTVYGAAGQGFLAVNAGVFQKRFPEIKIITVGGDRALPRILTERRAGKYLADVIVGGTSTSYGLHLAGGLDSLRSAMILPEVVDASKWWRGQHPFSDPGKRYTFSYIGHPVKHGFLYNPRHVDGKEFRSFWDFLNPKWKGKIASRDIRSPGPGSANMRGFYANPKLGPQFIRRLFSEMDITLFRDGRQGVDWVATGKFPICFFCTQSIVGIAKQQGIPIEAFGALKEGQSITASGGSVGLVNKAPHPNAAKVFINWLLSREGQLTVQQEFSKALLGVSNSRRIDIPKDMVPADERLEEGVEYIDTDTAESFSLEPSVLKVFNEALAAAGK